jgi:CYTH domain-containing protein
VFSIDVFEGELDGLILCETEAEGLEELMAIQPPVYVRHEVTEDPFFAGGNLCRTPRAELLRKLSTFA